jgi:hypothetical protein
MALLYHPLNAIPILHPISFLPNLLCRVGDSDGHTVMLLAAWFPFCVRVLAA